MKSFKFLLLIFISLATSIKADSNKNLIDQLKDSGKIIFIRHAYAPGNGDPSDFNLNDCSTQRNLSNRGKIQSREIGKFFKENQIKIDKVLSSEWCRCKETAYLSFKDYETKNFLNSFYSLKFSKNRNKQMKELKKYIEEWQNEGNLVLMTHYVVISEFLGYAASSGEIVISNKGFKKIGSIEIGY